MSIERRGVTIFPGGCGLDTCRLAVAIGRYFGDCGKNFGPSTVRTYSNLPYHDLK